MFLSVSHYCASKRSIDLTPKPIEIFKNYTSPVSDDNEIAVWLLKHGFQGSDFAYFVWKAGMLLCPSGRQALRWVDNYFEKIEGGGAQKKKILELIQKKKKGIHSKLKMVIMCQIYLRDGVIYEQ